MLVLGKNILVTGASRGIGKFIAERFAQEGAAALVLCARDVAALERIKSDLEALYPVKVHVFGCDVSNMDDIKNLFEGIQQAGVSLDVLVNNAGIMKDAALMMVNKDLYDSNLNINLAGTVFITQKAIKHFIRKRAGSVINFTSIVGLNGAAGQSIYAASKAAIVGFTKALSKELAPMNIRVNAIAPGFIETDMVSHFNEDQRNKIIGNIGLKRPGTPTDVANAALYLASDLSTYVTGQVIGVDGGMII